MSGRISPKARQPVELASSVSGYPIAIESDPGLDVWSSVRFPRKGEKACLITFNPAYVKYLDYLVAHECGHIYRFFSAKPEERLLPAANPEGLRTAMGELQKETWVLKHYVRKDKMKEFLGSLCSGLVRQLASTPADCRIEPWIRKDFVALRDVQAAALREQHSMAAKCLRPEIERLTPPTIYEKSNSMNYVMANAIGRLLGEPSLIAPYVESGFSDIGVRLDSYLWKEDEGYADDMRVADSWATELGITDWYRRQRIT